MPFTTSRTSTTNRSRLDASTEATGRGVDDMKLSEVAGLEIVGADNAEGWTMQASRPRF